MSRPARIQLSRCELDALREFRLLPNLTKIPLFLGLIAGLTWMAWHSWNPWVLVPLYIALGYLWMSMVTFMHDALHHTLFRSKAANWAFGILCMLPIFATFVGFREDHIEHHRYNRSPQILVKGEELRQMEFTANFEADDPKSLIGFLSRYAQVDYERKGNVVVIRQRR